MGESITNDATPLEALKLKLSSLLEEVKAYIERNSEGHGYTLQFWGATENFNTAHQVFCASAASIGNAVTKFSLVNGKNPSADEAKSVSDALETPIDQMITALRLALHCGTGKALSKVLLSNSNRLLTSLHDLIVAIQSENLDTKVVAQITGRVWEYVEIIQKVPKSNRIAVKRNLLECVATIKDMLTELSELKEENHDTNITDEEDVIVEDDPMFGYLETQMEESELERLSTFLQLLSKMHFLSRMGIASLARLPPAEGQQVSESSLVWVDSLSNLYESLHQSIIEIGPSLYPPQTQEEYKTHLPLMKGSVTGIWNALHSFPEQDLFEGGSGTAAGGFDFDSLVNGMDELLESFSP